MKIKKLQTGGFLNYEPTQFINWNTPTGVNLSNESQQQSNSRTSRTSGVLDNNLISKDVAKQLMESGLSSDVSTYVRSLSNITPEMLENPRTAYRHLISQFDMVGKIKQNKEALDSALKLASDNNGLSEYAITSTGQVIVEDIKGKIRQISPNELQEGIKEQKYRILTNSELASRRQSDPAFAFNTNIAPIIGNAIGPDKISEYILGIAMKIGQDKFTREGYVNKKQERVTEGIQSLLSGAPNGVYKITQSGEDEQRKTEKQTEALNYIYSLLPQNMKNYLSVNAAADGQSPKAGAIKLIADMIDFTSKSDTTTKLDYDAQATKLSSLESGESTDSDAVTFANQSIQIANGNSTSQRLMELNTGTKYSVVQTAEWWQTPQDLDNNKPINKSITLDKLFTETSIAGVVDPGSVYFGGQLVTEDKFKYLVYNNNDGFATMLLPTTTDEFGHKKPDFIAIEEMGLAKKEISDKGDISNLEKKQIYQNHGVGDYFEMIELGQNANPNVVSPFLVFTGLATNDRDLGDFDAKDPLVSKNKDGYRNVYTKIYEEALNEPDTKGGKPGNNKISNFYNAIGIGNDDILSASVYIPLSNDIVSVYTAGKAYNIPKTHTMSDRILSNTRINQNKSQLGQTNF